MKITKRVIAIVMVLVFCLTSISVSVSAATKTHLNKSKTVITLGGSYNLKLISSTNKVITSKKVSWKSSNAKIVKVNSNGKIYGISKGKATISSKYNGKTYKCTVTVKPASRKYASKTLYVGSKITQTLTSPSGKKISSSKITWTTSNKKVATVSSKGTITAKGKGKATITAKYLGEKYSCTITVKSKSYSSSSSSSTQKVWIPTNGGTKYHTNSTCSKMKNPIKVTKKEAVNQGFGPCGRCY